MYNDCNPLVSYESMTPEGPLTVQHPGSALSEMYVLNAPYMLTLEQCICPPFSFEYTRTAPGHYYHTVVPSFRPYTTRERPLHQHNFLEIMYVLEGSLTQHIEDNIYEYRAGQCCILNNHTKHCEDLAGNYKAAFLMLSDDFLHFLFQLDLMPDEACSLHIRKSPILHFIAAMFSQNTQLTKTYLDFTPKGGLSELLRRINGLFDAFLLETRDYKPGSYLLAAGLVTRLLSMLEDPSLYIMHQVSLQESRDGILFTAIARILETHDGRVSRKELERLTHYSGDYLNWIVKKHTGRSLTEYGQSFCLVKAEQLLTQTDLPVSAIIRELGFTNRSYFYRIFRQHYGMTPKIYRSVNKNQFTQENTPS